MLTSLTTELVGFTPTDRAMTRDSPPVSGGSVDRTGTALSRGGDLRLPPRWRAYPCPGPEITTNERRETYRSADCRPRLTVLSDGSPSETPQFTPPFNRCSESALLEFLHGVLREQLGSRGNTGSSVSQRLLVRVSHRTPHGVRPSVQECRQRAWSVGNTHTLFVQLQSTCIERAQNSVYAVVHTQIRAFSCESTSRLICGGFDRPV